MIWNTIATNHHSIVVSDPLVLLLKAGQLDHLWESASFPNTFCILTNNSNFFSRSNTKHLKFERNKYEK